MGYAITFEHLQVFYGNKPALKDVSLVIPQDCIAALIGPSGSGKTTLLRSINRLNVHLPGCSTSGKIFLGEVDVFSPTIDMCMLRRMVGMVFQKPNSFPFSVMENMRLPLLIGGERNNALLRCEAQKYLELVGLWNEIEGQVDAVNGLELSVGQQQRLCLARALIVQPKVLLLDEPCSALDPLSTAKIESLLLQLKASVTIIIATHNLAQAKRIADHTVFLLNGEIIENGTTEQIFHAPIYEQTRGYTTGLFG